MILKQNLKKQNAPSTISEEISLATFVLTHK